MTITLKGTIQVVDPNAVPAYLSGLANYEVSQIASAVGNATLLSATPTGGSQGDWVNSDPAGNAGPGNSPNIVVPWCSGCWDEANHYMYVHGGGHDDSANNGLYRYDFSGDTPQGFSLLDISNLSIVPTGSGNHDPYPDGRPGSVHTYDGVGFYNGTVFRVGGSTYKTGSLGGGTYTYSGGWTSRTDYPGSTGEGQIHSVAVNPVAGKALVFNRGAFDCVFYRFADNTWSGTKSLANALLSSAGYHTACFHGGTNQVIVKGGSQFFVYTVDWDAETVTLATSTDPGLPNVSGPFMAYDSVRDSVWVIGGPAGAGFSTLYELTGSGSSWSVASNALSGDAIGVQSGLAGGMFKRGAFFPDWRAIALCTHSQQAPYVIKVPS